MNVEDIANVVRIVVADMRKSGKLGKGMQGPAGPQGEPGEVKTPQQIEITVLSREENGAIKKVLVSPK